MLASNAHGPIVVLGFDELVVLIPIFEQLSHRHRSLGLVTPNALVDLLTEGRQAIVLRSFAELGNPNSVYDPNGSDSFLSVKSVYSLTGIPARTIRDRAVKGRIPGSKKLESGAWLIPAASAANLKLEGARHGKHHSS